MPIEEPSKLGPSGLVIGINGHRYTRKHKITQDLAAISEALPALTARYENRVALWIQSEKTEISLKEPDLSSELQGLCFIIQNMSFEEIQGSQRTLETGFSVFIHLNAKADPRKFEQYFNLAKQRGIKGVAFDIEHFSKGQIALAHKFGLETILTGIKHERHEKLALESGSDHLCVNA